MTAEKPILFSGSMVRAILDGTKNQTRRVVVPSNSFMDGIPAKKTVWSELKLDRGWIDPGPSPAGNLGPYIKAPRPWVNVGSPVDETIHRIYSRLWTGIRLWVKETHVLENTDRPLSDRPWKSEAGEFGNYTVPHYRASEPEPHILPPNWNDLDTDDDRTRWRPSIFMPRWASRITLEITSVRPERLQDITAAAAALEGFYVDRDAAATKAAFRECWDSLNEKRGFGWDSNPWVWVVVFKRTV